MEVDNVLDNSASRKDNAKFRLEKEETPLAIICEQRTGEGRQGHRRLLMHIVECESG